MIEFGIGKKDIWISIMIKSAGLLIIKNGKALLVKPRTINSNNNWSIPKGIIDPNDKNIIETAIRETFEETGILIPQHKIDTSKRSIISYVDSKGLLTKIIFYFIVEISDEDYIEYKISERFDVSEIETFDFFPFREARKKIYWKQQSVLNFLKPDSFCINELEELIRLGYIYKVKHPTFPLWLYNITRKCKLYRNWNYTTLSCRGLILDESGKIVARPFKKFFEKKDIHQEILDILPENKVITEKLDGALGILYTYKNNHYICCKNNFNHYSGVKATDIFYNDFYPLEFPEIKDHTFLFEIISSKIPFTINYSIKDSIIPIGIIDNATIRNNFSILDHFGKLEITTENVLSEGFVEFYADGTMIKNKSKDFMEEYKLLKKSKKRKFNDDFESSSHNLLDRKKVIDHSNINILKNFEDFSNSIILNYQEKIIYWI